MPAAAPFLAHGGILGAAYLDALKVGRITDVAANTLANVVDSALPDLVGEKRVCDRGARGTDEIEDSFLHLAKHRIGGGEAADANDRLLGDLLHP